MRLWVRRGVFLWLIALAGCQIGAPSEGTPESAVWSGRWASEQRGYISGQVSLRLPDPLQPAGQYRVPAKFESAWLLLSKGQPTTESWLNLQVTDAPPPTGDEASAGALQLRLVTRGIFGLENQEVVYEARFDQEDTVIEGRYTSVSPKDRGWFRVERVGPDANGASPRQAPQNPGESPTAPPTSGR